MAEQNDDPLAIALAVLCSIILLGVILQIVLIVRGRHNLYSLQTGVLVLCVLWLPLRVLFWVKTMQSTTWNDSLMLTLFSLPTCLQFSTFSLLALFYAKVVNWRQWDGRTRQLADSDEAMRGYSYRSATPPVDGHGGTHRLGFGERGGRTWPCGSCCTRRRAWNLRRRFLAAFWLSNAAVWASTIACGLVDARAMQLEADAPDAARVRVCVDSAIFMALALTLATLGLQFRRARRQNVAFSAHMLPRSPQAFAALNLCLCVAFACRAIMQVLLLFSPNVFPDGASTLEFNGKHKPMHWLIFILYIVWEVVPTAAILVMLGKIPGKRRLPEVHFRSPAKVAGGPSGGGGGPDDGDDLQDPLLCP
eukprot:g6990.t1